MLKKWLEPLKAGRCSVNFTVHTCYDTYNVSSNADEHYGYGANWKRDASNDEQEEWSQLWYVGR